MRSKLPDVGTTIFTVMSRRAAELGAVNLGQGFPDYAIDPRLAQFVAQAMCEGYNQYAPMAGSMLLRERIAAKFSGLRGLIVDPESEITITLGATEAIFSAIQAVVGPGDEAIIFDPAYDSYEPAIRLSGGQCVRIPLAPPQFAYDWDRVRGAINERTRMIVVNSPHNPACTTLAREDLDQLAAAIGGRDIIVLSDEVYEHVIFDGREHHSVLQHEDLATRSIAVYSFGKVLHSTGLRVGYAIAPESLTTEVRKVHQFNTFSIAHSLQQAIALYVDENPGMWRELGPFLQSRRDLLTSLLEGCGLHAIPAQGSFFQLFDFAALSQRNDQRFANELLEIAGVATIPLSVFYAEPPKPGLLRLCFAKEEATLRLGAERLQEFARDAGL
ncbi:MAG: methionine aminotransferase [Steroidobacteraceae bacterium]